MTTARTDDKNGPRPDGAGPGKKRAARGPRRPAQPEPPNTNQDHLGALDQSLLIILEKIKRRMHEFTPRQRIVAEYMLHHPESLAFMSIMEMAEKVHASEATIVRFCNTLGYDGYASLTGEVRQAIQLDFGLVDRFKLGRIVRSQAKPESDGSLFSRIIASEIENLVNLSQSIRVSHFHACVDRMLAADRICVIGCMASDGLARHLYNMLGKILPDVDCVTNHDVASSLALRRLTKASVTFLLSFPRYPRVSLELARTAAEQGSFIVAITNSHMSPAVQLADMAFYVSVNVPSFVDAYAAPVAFINALATEAGLRDPEAAQAVLDQYDQYVAKYDLFVKKSGEWRPRFGGQPEGSGKDKSGISR
ncbi:MAG: MurR/RpiR family transcriptional regulator [Thermodesulfobacteriota bacterium]